MVRTGQVDVKDPPAIPVDEFLRGANERDEEYDVDGDGSAYRLVMTAMKELDDPAPLDKHKTYDYSTGTGDLVDALEGEAALNYDDVQQGAIGNCYFVAALAATVYADVSGALRQGLIRTVTDDDGNPLYFTVRFYDAWGTPQDIDVDGDIVRRSGNAVYARSADTRSGAEEWWVSLVEKAYAEWHGGYTAIGEGGYPGDVMQALNGATATFRTLKYLGDETVVSSVLDAVTNNRPVVAVTFGEDAGVDYSGTNIYADHAYSVLNARTSGGKYYVTLRNPWGEVEPAGNGEDDGIFEIEMSEFKRLYTCVYFGGSTPVDRIAPDPVEDLSLVSAGADSVTLRFTASGDDADKGLAAAYDLRRCDSADQDFYDCQEITLAGPQAPGTPEEVTVGGLVAGQTSWFSLKVEDEAGNISGISNVVEATTEGGASDQGELYDWEQLQDFELGEGGWEVSGLFHRSSKDAASGSWSMWFGDETTGTYDTGARVSGTLTSPRLDAREASHPVLLWEHALDAESGAGTDKAWVEVATEASGYTNWQTVWEKDSTTSDFELMYVDLNIVSGQIVRLRFHFDSMDERSNGYPGWFVDDVWTTEE